MSGGNANEYWAWWDNKEQAYRHVYRGRSIVEMCSPDGFKGATARGEGKIVQVKIEEVVDDRQTKDDK